MWELDCEEGWMPKNWCFWTVVLEKTLESPLDCKEIYPVHSKGDQSWVFIGRTDAEAETLGLWPPRVAWCEELTHLKRPWCCERLKAGGEGGDRGWDGWMASLTRWTWVWASSRSWWWTGRPGVLQSTVSQRVGHDWVTELNWTPSPSPSFQRVALKCTLEAVTKADRKPAPDLGFRSQVPVRDNPESHPCSFCQSSCPELNCPQEFVILRLTNEWINEWTPTYQTNEWRRTHWVERHFKNSIKE